MRNRHGSMLVLSLGTIVFLSIVGSTTLLRGLHEEQTSRRSSALQKAFFLAETSLDATIDNLRQGQSGDLPTTVMAGGSFWATVTDSTEDPTLLPLHYRITGHGLYQAGQRDVEALVHLMSPQSVFQFAMFGDQSMTVSGSVITDSYDSSLGPYDPNNPGQNGDVGTNSTTAGAVTISGSIAINGQVAVGEDAVDPNEVVSIGGEAIITGEPPIIAQSSNLQMPGVDPPAGLSCDITFNVGGQQTMALPADAPQGACNANNECCFLNMSVGGGGTVTVDGPVTVYVTEQFSAGGNTTIGSLLNPGHLILILTSSQTGTLGSVSGNTLFSGGIYAPNGGVNVSGNADVYGSIVANSVTISGDAQIHYDEALANTGPVGSYDAELLAWYELD